MIDPDDDVGLYDLDVSEGNDEFFQDIAEKHRELFDEPPEAGGWIHSPSQHPLDGLAAAPESVEAIIQVIVDVWETGGLDVEDARYTELLDDISIEEKPDHLVPDQLKR